MRTLKLICGPGERGIFFEAPEFNMFPVRHLAKLAAPHRKNNI